MKSYLNPQEVIPGVDLIEIHEDDIKINTGINAKDLSLQLNLKSLNDEKELDYDTHLDIK